MLWIVLLILALITTAPWLLRHHTREDQFTRGLRQQGLEFGMMTVFGLAVATALWSKISGVDAVRPYAVGVILAVLGLNPGELWYARWRLRR